MGILYVDRKDVELRSAAGRLNIYEAGYQSSSIPLALLDRIVIANRARLDSTLLSTLAEEGISLVVMHTRKPQRTAHLLGGKQNDAARRLAQYQGCLDEQRRTAFAASLIERKLVAQLRFLRCAMHERSDQRHALFNATAAVEARLQVLRTDGALTRSRVRGIEGAAASAYFQGLQVLFAPTLGFNGRNRRPPRDPVNACLSLTYTLLHSAAVQALHIAGLDPQLGFYHDIAFGRDSLACDLVEPLRPHADGWVWRLFRERRLRVESFTQDKGACLLGKEGRGVFFREYEALAGPARRHLQRMAAVLARSLTKEAIVPLVELPEVDEELE